MLALDLSVPPPTPSELEVLMDSLGPDRMDVSPTQTGLTESRLAPPDKAEIALPLTTVDVDPASATGAREDALMSGFGPYGVGAILRRSGREESGPMPDSRRDILLGGASEMMEDSPDDAVLADEDAVGFSNLEAEAEEEVAGVARGL